MSKSCACNKQEIIDKMRILWSQHVYWTRFFIISTAEELADLECVTARLLENPCDFAQELKKFYSEKEADRFKCLLTDHLKTAGELVNADKDNDRAKAVRLRMKWYGNADDIALFLGRLSPYWNEYKWREMMRSHLCMTEKEAALRLNREYQKDICMFGSVEKGALEMADYMAEGIICQFGCK